MKKISFRNSKVELLSVISVLHVINRLKWMLYEEQYNGYGGIMTILDLYDVISYFL